MRMFSIVILYAVARIFDFIERPRIEWNARPRCFCQWYRANWHTMLEWGEMLFGFWMQLRAWAERQKCRWCTKPCLLISNVSINESVAISNVKYDEGEIKMSKKLFRHVKQHGILVALTVLTYYNHISCCYDFPCHTVATFPSPLTMWMLQVEHSVLWTGCWLNFNN